MSESEAPNGALAGIRVLDFSRLGPGPYLTMLLADHGAEVLVVQRPLNERQDPAVEPRTDRELTRAPLYRGKDVVTIDLKNRAGMRTARSLALDADVVVESFRPGVMARLGLGPAALCEDNPRLVYCSVTGYGQDGPFADEPGHDPNFLALSGLLEHVGSERPELPLNVVGDFAGGGLMGVIGILLALNARAATGRGQHIDVSMTEGVLSLLTLQYGWWAAEEPQRGAGRFDGSEPYHAIYETADERFVAVGAAEERFRRNVDRLVGLDAGARQPHESHLELAERFRRSPRDYWAEVARGEEACVTPVLSLREAALHPHFAARRAFAHGPSGAVPGPVPRLAMTPGRAAAPGRRALRAPTPADGRLGPFRLDPQELRALVAAGVVS